MGTNDKKLVNQNDKFSKGKKTLALAVASGIVTSSLTVANVSATEISKADLSGNIILSEENNVVENYPTVKTQTVNYDLSKGKDLVITGVECYGKKLTNFSITKGEGTVNVDGKFITYNDAAKTLTIPYEKIKELNLEVGVQACGLTFSDGTITIGEVKLNLSKTEVVEDTETAKAPTVKKQTINFDKSKEKDLVITGVEYNSEELLELTITNGEKVESIKAKDIIYNKTEKTLTVPYAKLKNLDLEIGIQSCGLMFSKGTITIGEVKVNVTKSEVVEEKPVVPPTNEDVVVPPSQDVVVVKKPTIESQIVTYDKAKSKDVVIDKVNYNNNKLVSIYLGGRYISANELVIGDDTITIPAKVLESINILKGNYEITFSFSNSMSVSNAVDLQVIDTTVVAPPVDKEDEVVKPSVPEKVEEIVIDSSNLKAVEIANFIPKDSKVSYVTINGKRLEVVYKNARVRTMADAPVVYVDGDKLILSAEVLKYIGFESDSLKIEAVLNDGNVVTREMKINVVNNTEKPETSKPPVEDKDDKVEDSENTDKDEVTTPDDKEDSSVTPDEKEDASDNVNEDKKEDISDEVNKDEVTNSNVSNSSSEVPKTGYAAGQSLIGAIMAGVSTFFLKKRK